MQLNKFSFVIVGFFALSACGSLGPEEFETALPASNSSVPVRGVSDTPVRIGAPYQIGSTTYTPEDVAAYDEVGYASWYGADFEGRQTANGEVFTALGFTGAHKTLPLPTYVEVTALETGRTILVRLNDRGPFANDRLIDLSEAAARQLGIIDQGVAGVRVRKVNPPEQERAVLRNGNQAIQRIDTPESLTRILLGRLAELPKPRPPINAVPRVAGNVAGSNNQNGRFVPESSANQESENQGSRLSNPIASASGFVVQLASFSTRERAQALAQKVGGNVAPSSDGKLFRVRYGPFATDAQAQEGLAKAQQRGYPQARIFRE